MAETGTKAPATGERQGTSGETTPGASNSGSESKRTQLGKWINQKLGREVNPKRVFNELSDGEGKGGRNSKEWQNVRSRNRLMGSKLNHDASKWYHDNRDVIDAKVKQQTDGKELNRAQLFEERAKVINKHRETEGSRLRIDIATTRDKPEFKAKVQAKIDAATAKSDRQVSSWKAARIERQLLREELRPGSTPEGRAEADRAHQEQTTAEQAKAQEDKRVMRRPGFNEAFAAELKQRAEGRKPTDAEMQDARKAAIENTARKEQEAIAEADKRTRAEKQANIDKAYESGKYYDKMAEVAAAEGTRDLPVDQQHKIAMNKAIAENIKEANDAAGTTADAGADAEPGEAAEADAGTMAETGQTPQSVLDTLGFDANQKKDLLLKMQQHPEIANAIISVAEMFKKSQSEGDSAEVLSTKKGLFKEALLIIIQAMLSGIAGAAVDLVPTPK